MQSWDWRTGVVGRDLFTRARQFAPEGRVRIAQRFIAGIGIPQALIQSRRGTAESRLGRLFQSSLFRDFRFRSPFQPSDKSLGYCQMSLRDKPPHSRYHVRETDFHFVNIPNNAGVTQGGLIPTGVPTATASGLSLCCKVSSENDPLPKNSRGRMI